jgi:hypothetical protein
MVFVFPSVDRWFMVEQMVLADHVSTICLWLGTAPAAQPTFPESKHLSRFHQKPD